jgi:hypothetical protein
LGLLFSKENNSENFITKHKYLQKKENTMEAEELKQILEAVMSLPAMQYCEAQMQKAQSEAESPPEEGKMAYEEKDKLDVEGNGEDDDEGNNLLNAVEGEEPEKAKLRMQYQQTRRNYAKLEQDHKALFAKVAELERNERVANRKNDLMQLDAEGFVFDLSEELDVVADMQPERFSKHISSMRKNYKKGPIGVKLNPYNPQNEKQEKPYNPRECMLEAHTQNIKGDK